VGSGAGAEMRRAMGVAVFSGMLGVTAFGIFLTPVFYILLRGSTARRRAHAAEVRAECDASAHPYHPGEDPPAEPAAPPRNPV
jgi:multidrug efflux pump